VTVVTFTISTLATLFSLGLGLFGLVFPDRALRLVGLQEAPGLRHSISEARATYGGVFIGASLYPLISGEPHALLTLAACWLLAGTSRLCSLLIDRAATSFNALSIAIELTIAALIALPYLAAL
jgi:hypothetical protein